MLFSGFLPPFPLPLLRVPDQARSTDNKIATFEPKKILDVMALAEEDLEKPGTWANFFCEDFMGFYVTFLHHQTLCQIDQRGMQMKMKDAEDCILKLFSPSDEAVAVFQYLNNYKKWGEIAANVDNLDHPCHSKREGGCYTKTVGRRRFETGFTDEGMDIYGKILKFVKASRDHADYPKLQEACKKYYKEDAGGAALRRACSSNSATICSAVGRSNNKVQEREAFVDEELIESDPDDEDDEDDEYDGEDADYGRADLFGTSDGGGEESDEEIAASASGPSGALPPLDIDDGNVHDEEGEEEEDDITSKV